jgi:hypothetical protein
MAVSNLAAVSQSQRLYSGVGVSNFRFERRGRWVYSLYIYIERERGGGGLGK